MMKSALFVTGLSDSQVKRDVRRAHPKTLQDAIRAARTSYEDLQVDTPGLFSNAVSGRLRQLKRRDARLSAEERQRLLREGRCFRCRELGHRAVNCLLVKRPTPLSPVFNLVEAKKNRSIRGGPQRKPPVRGGARALAEIGVLKELCNEDRGHRRHDLLIVTVKCGNCEARTLIDSGATHNIASADWIRKAELTTIDDGDEFSILLADGRKQTTRAI